MNKYTFKKIMAVIAIAAAIAGPALTAVPASAAVSVSVNEEVINQARSIASVIQTRIQLYWSMWIDKQIPYTGSAG